MFDNRRRTGLRDWQDVDLWPFDDPHFSDRVAGALLPYTNIVAPYGSAAEDVVAAGGALAGSIGSGAQAITRMPNLALFAVGGIVLLIVVAVLTQHK